MPTGSLNVFLLEDLDIMTRHHMIYLRFHPLKVKLKIRSSGPFWYDRWDFDNLILKNAI